MTTGRVFIATSLDGFIAREDGKLDWLENHGPADPGEDYGYKKFIDQIDGLIMGRGSFETVVEFEPWPYDKPVVVLSHSLSADDIPQHLREKVRIFADTPREIMQKMAKEGWQRAYIDGGKIIQSFLRAGLIDELIITRVPVLLGQGISLFGELPSDILLEHIDTQSFSSGLVQSKYKVSGNS